ncbi:MAG: DUF445 family protein [Desulfuromonadaceae bacterium]
MLSSLEAHIPFLPYLIPPLLGALIGYVTNYIAIRMLFRPLRAWHLFGIRIPMTPGIIPARRGDLARKMGHMVGEHLLTSGDVGRTLDKPEFRTQVYDTLAHKLDAFIQRPLGAPISLVPRRLQRRVGAIVEQITGRIGSKVGKVVQSAVFARRLEHLSTQAAEELLGRELREVLDQDSYIRMRTHAASAIQEWLQRPETRDQLQHWLDTQLESFLSSDTSLDDLLPQDIKELLTAKLHAQIPALGQELIQAMRTGENRAELEKMARTGVDGVIESVEGLSALVGALFDMNIIYARLPEFIDKALDSVDEWLKTDAAHDAIGAVVDKRIEELIQRPASEWVEGLSYAEVRKLKNNLNEAAYTFLTSATLHNHVLELLDAAFTQHGHRTLGELSSPLLGDKAAGRAERLGAEASRYILNFLHSDKFSRTSSAWMERMANQLVYERPLGTLATYLPSDAREELYQGLMRQFILLLKKELPPLVESLNVARIVEDKVNQLDLLEVEDLLMGIMREQFRYINMFGALLGFILGLLNLVLLYM